MSLIFQFEVFAPGDKNHEWFSCDERDTSLEAAVKAAEALSWPADDVAGLYVDGLALPLEQTIGSLWENGALHEGDQVDLVSKSVGLG